MQQAFFMVVNLVIPWVPEVWPYSGWGLKVFLGLYCGAFLKFGLPVFYRHMLKARFKRRAKLYATPPKSIEPATLSNRAMVASSPSMPTEKNALLRWLTVRPPPEDLLKMLSRHEDDEIALAASKKLLHIDPKEAWEALSSLIDSRNKATRTQILDLYNSQQGALAISPERPTGGELSKPQTGELTALPNHQRDE